MKKEEIRQIEENINALLDVFFESRRKGNVETAEKAVERITYEMNKLRTEDELQIGKETYIH